MNKNGRLEINMIEGTPSFKTVPPKAPGQGGHFPPVVEGKSRIHKKIVSAIDFANDKKDRLEGKEDEFKEISPANHSNHNDADYTGPFASDCESHESSSRYSCDGGDSKPLP